MASSVIFNLGMVAEFKIVICHLHQSFHVYSIYYILLVKFTQILHTRSLLQPFHTEEALGSPYVWGFDHQQ